jgi:hypothetical protein
MHGTFQIRVIQALTYDVQQEYVLIFKTPGGSAEASSMSISPPTFLVVSIHYLIFSASELAATLLFTQAP